MSLTKNYYHDEMYESYIFSMDEYMEHLEEMKFQEYCNNRGILFECNNCDYGPGECILNDICYKENIARDEFSKLKAQHDWYSSNSEDSFVNF